MKSVIERERDLASKREREREMYNVDVETNEIDR